ncbi:flagellar biosynthetic protein FliO [Bdellovibrio sp. NC01]|uniref:FliO/MopB family protein n=1 Tax=Bdellovibrio sp. NC01 TaxID=2220073 RepID=UPI001FED862A|nr:flagellar biosynthetic protein FliO [Bdellovibrio sp. NC01]
MRWLLPLLFVISVSAQAAEEASPATEATAVASASAHAEATTPVTADAEKPKVDNRKESEIPLNLDGNKKASAEGGGMFRILFTLSMLGVVGTGAYIFLKKYSVPKSKKHQTQIKILQQHFLGPKKSLAIVRVAGESILVGITDHNISMIKSLSLLDDEVPEEAPKSFGNVLGGFKASTADFSETEDEAVTETKAKRKSNELDSDEEFAISGIKDIVSKRLKGMRSF